MDWWIYSEDHKETNIDKFHIAFYDPRYNYECFDEDFIEPDDFNYQHLAYIKDGLDTDCSKLFVHLKNGKTYQLFAKEVRNVCRKV